MWASQTEPAESRSAGPSGARVAVRATRPRRPRNDPAQYDDLADQWWPPHAAFAALRWLAVARARLVPPPLAPGTALLDVACGAGLLAPHLPPGWRHVGVDLSVAALSQARDHAMIPVRADALRLPFADGAFACVVAGECLEHLPDLPAACAEVARVLAPGGTLVLDTIARSLFSRVVLVALAERMPGGPPPRCHDPALLVDRAELRRHLLAAGVELEPLIGLRPSAAGYLRWLARRAPDVAMVRVRFTAGVFQARGRKAGARAADGPSAPVGEGPSAPVREGLSSPMREGGA